MSETTPWKLPDSSRRRASAPDSVETTAVAVALEDGAYQGHDGGFVLDQEDGRERDVFSSCWSFGLHSCHCAERCGVGRHRQAHSKRGAFRIRIVVANNFAAMFADDAIANAEAEAGALADIFGGKEGIEDAFGIG